MRLVLDQGKETLQGSYWVGDGSYPLPERDIQDATERLTNDHMEVGLLPPVVRYLSASGRGVLLERPPQRMEIVYRGVPKEHVAEATVIQEFSIPLPWTLYAVLLSENYHPMEVYIFATNGPLRDKSTRLRLMPMTNVDRTAKLCRPDTPVAEEYSSIAEGVNAAYHQVWDSNFNTDITDAVDYAYFTRNPDEIFNGRYPIDKSARKSAGNIYKRWEAHSVEDVTEWEWLAIEQWNGYVPEAGNTSITVSDVVHYLDGMDAQRHQANYLFNHIRQRLL